MKSLLGFLAVCMLGFIGAMWYLNNAGGSDPGVAMPAAIGKGAGGSLQFYAGVQRELTRVEPPRVASLGKPVTNEWVAQHFTLVDDQGAPVGLQAVTVCPLFSAERAGYPEFYLQGEIRPNVSYTFDYIPMTASRLHYRVTFSAPVEGLPFERMLLEEVLID